MSRALVALSAALALSARRVDANDVVDDAARTRDALTSRLTTKTVRLERFATDLESLAANDYDEYAASSGYFALNRTTKDAHMFYTFFDARSGGAESEDAIPIILWLTGGPGCSSELAALYENGPFAFDDDDATKLKRRKYAWNDAGRLLYVDSPVNTGFSYSSSRRDAAKDETTVANDLLEFLYAFMLSRPMLVDAPVYVTGESYAGHYVPAFARAIFDANARDDGPVRINLQGLAIGNGLTDPAIQYAAYADYSLGNDIVSAATVKQTAKKLPSCVEKIKSCASGKTSSKENRAECLDAVDSCQAIPEALLEDAAERNGGKAINVYDIRKSCDAELCYDFSAAEAFLNRKDVQEAFGVSKKWEMCDASVHQDMMGDWMHDYETLIPDMIEAGIRVMIYAGEDDFICNWLGNLRWVKAMQWNGREAFNAARPEPFIIQGAGDGEDDVVGGDVREHGGLSFVKISEAGHMVPMDQPRNALTMIQRFVNNEPIARGRGGDEPKLSAAPRRFGPVEDDVVGRLAVATQK